MKRASSLLIILSVVCTSLAHAGEAKVEAAIAVDQDTKPATTFGADVPKLYAFFKTKGTEKGEKLRGVWIAEDVGDAAPANTKIDEATLTADQDVSSVRSRSANRTKAGRSANTAWKSTTAMNLPRRWNSRSGPRKKIPTMSPRTNRRKSS